jgi:AraC-like DNA-binding protein
MFLSLLDTTALAPRERDHAAREFFDTLSELDVLEHACPPEAIRTRVLGWDLRQLRLLVADSPWLHLAHTGRQVMTEAVSFSAQLGGTARLSLGDESQTFAPGEISLVDLSSPFGLRSAESCTIMSFQLSYAELCLPGRMIQSAVGDLTASPLYDLFQAHLFQLYRCLGEAVPASATESLGAATVELARAVIATTDHGDPARNDVANQTLLTRIEAYVQQHLADPALSPETIASAHGISVRQLYKLWSVRDLSLAEWIMRGRLEGARHDLARDTSAAVGAVARRWGFSDSTHFGRRFRSAYDLSPREWRRAQDKQDGARPATS